MCQVLSNITGIKVASWKLIVVSAYEKLDSNSFTQKCNRPKVWLRNKTTQQLEKFSTKAAGYSKTMEHLRFMKVKMDILFNSIQLGSLARNGFNNWNPYYFMP